MIEELQTIEVHDWGIHVTLNEGLVIGNDCLGQRVEYIIERCKKEGKKRLLNDVRLSTIETSAGTLAMASERMAQIMGEGFRFAMVSTQLHGTDVARDHEKASTHAGISLKYFTDIDEAKSWLMER